MTLAETKTLKTLLAALATSDDGCIRFADWRRMARLPATRNNLESKGYVKTFPTYKPNLEVWVTITDAGLAAVA